MATYYHQQHRQKSKFNFVSLSYLQLVIFCLLQHSYKISCSIGNENEENRNQPNDKPNNQTCKHFDGEKFRRNVNQPSIFLIVPRGRLGNMMLGYSIILELQNRLKIQPLVTRDCLSFLKTTFEEDTLTVPAIEDTYCNRKHIPFEPFEGTFRELITNTSYHTNRLLWLYPPKGNRNIGGYRYKLNWIALSPFFMIIHHYNIHSSNSYIF